MNSAETNNSGFKKFSQKFTAFSVKIGNQVHLRSLRDAFAAITPAFILAGLGILLSSVIFPWLIHGSDLAKWQTFGTVISDGTLNIASVLIAPMTAYYLAKNKGYKSPLSTVPVALSALFIMLSPTIVTTLASNANKTVKVTGAVLYNDIGTQGMFAGIIVGLLGTEIYMRLTKIKKLRINLGENVPPAVNESFNVMIPTMIVLVIFGIISAVLLAFNTSFITLVSNLLQTPLKELNTSIWGFLLIYSIGNLLYGFGIHQNVINGTLVYPLALIAMNENMAEVAAGKAPTNIVNSDFVTCYTQMGGTRGTIALMLAVFLFCRSYKPYRDVCKIALAPGIFEINEPIIFGFPIVFNIPMIIPFVLAPVIGGIIGWGATVLKFVQPLSVYVPWTTPPLISGFLSSRGDWKVVIVQVIILIITTLFYIPFIKISAKVAKESAELRK